MFNELNKKNVLKGCLFAKALHTLYTFSRTNNIYIKNEY